MEPPNAGSPSPPLRFAVLLAAMLAAAAAPAERWFEDVTARAGLAAKHANRTFHNPYAEIMAGFTALGAAAVLAE